MMAKTRHTIENFVREPVELYSGIVMLCAGLLCYQIPSLFLLTSQVGVWAGCGLFATSLVRFWQGFKLKRYHVRLLSMPHYALSTIDVPISRSTLFIGRGFEWEPLHRQRLHLLGQLKDAHYLKPSRLTGYARRYIHAYPHSTLAKGLSAPFSPFKPLPPVGGKSWLHGVGSDRETVITLPQANRNSHTLVFGMTRVGKTRLLSTLVNQDIRNGEAVLLIDPKGDADLLKDMYAACKAAGRLSDFRILHAGMPEISAKYNPLFSFSDISEVATRVTSAISAEGEGKQFADFAWRYLNITSTCLREMGEPINYRTLSFFVMRPRQLLMAYCDKTLPAVLPDYEVKVTLMLEKLLSAHQGNRKGAPVEIPTRADAVRELVAKFIEENISEGNAGNLQQGILNDLHHAAKMGEEFYGKITASLSPVFDKINKTAAGDIFSWESSFGLPVVNLEEVIKRKQICYIGLDSMSNKTMSEAVGQAVIADLISLCGRLYKDNPNQVHSLCLHADELAEMVRDEFITLVNKAGGAGIKVTAYTQTINDLGAVFGTNQHKPKMLLGNFGTIIMLRVANLDTARVFTECLPSVLTLSGLPSTTSQDKSFGENGELFTTSNTDVIQQERQQLIVENDVFSLPKGQAFVLTQGGTVYKIRIPLPKNEENKDTNIAFLISEVNLCYAS